MAAKKITDAILEGDTYNELQKEFTKIVVPMKQKYRDYVANFIEKTIKAAEPTLKSSKDLYRPEGKHYTIPFKHVMQSVFSPAHHPDEINRVGGPRGSYSPGAPYGLDPKYMDRVNKEADEAADNFHDGFIAKNARKFADLIGDKKIQEIKHTIHGDLDGRMKVTFTDGSSFDTSFSTISKVSSKGTFFNQWPTKFHAVTFADGSKMSQPSEEKMKKHFSTNGVGEGKIAPAPEKPTGNVSISRQKYPSKRYDVRIGRKKVGEMRLHSHSDYEFEGFHGTRDEVFAHVKEKHGAPTKPVELDTAPIAPVAKPAAKPAEPTMATAHPVAASVAHHAVDVPKVGGLNHPTGGQSKASIVQAIAHSMPMASAHAIAKVVHQRHPEITLANANYYARKIKGK